MTTIAGMEHGEIGKLRVDAENLIENARGFRTLAFTQSDICRFRRNPASDSDLMSATVPI